MDTLDTYRQIIERVLTEYAQIPYAYGEIQSQTVFDREGDHVLAFRSPEIRKHTGYAVA